MAAMTKLIWPRLRYSASCWHGQIRAMQGLKWLIALRVHYTRGQRWWENPVIAELYKSSISAEIQEESSCSRRRFCSRLFSFHCCNTIIHLDTPDVLSNILLYNYDTRNKVNRGRFTPFCASEGPWLLHAELSSTGSGCSDVAVTARHLDLIIL